ncbi:hypothetical protein [Streptomonospora arabica]|uniref:Transposase IS701-like DDE domain-containing protein n=1 Tax=Streptomonospora arabica TaxID=412417 RepID=A0ABV9SHZ6_9ACTN
MRRWVREVGTGKVARAFAYLVTSLPAERIGAAALAGLARRHWRIGARHHVRDVSFGEDASRARTGHGPQNTAIPKATGYGLGQSMVVAGLLGARGIGRLTLPEGAMTCEEGVRHQGLEP